MSLNPKLGCELPESVVCNKVLQLTMYSCSNFKIAETENCLIYVLQLCEEFFFLLAT